MSARALAAFVLASWVCVSPVWGGSTDPTLAIGEVLARSVGAGVLADVSGIFGFDDVVQVDFPVRFLAYRGTRFTCFPVGGQPFSGEFAGLSDGLATGEIAALEAAGAPDPSAEILRIEPRRMTLALPQSLAAGVVTFVTYVELPGEGAFLSNSVAVSLGGGPLP